MDESLHPQRLTNPRLPKPQPATPPTRPLALITGASSGIGRELAREFARHGYDLVLVARREQAMRQLGEELQVRHGTRWTVIAVDLSQPLGVEDVMTRLHRAGLTVDALVNSAGFGLGGPFVETSWRKEQDMLRVNVMALTELTKRLLPDMIKRGSGRILNVASTAAFQPGPWMAVYYAAKAYVLSFSEAIAHEVRGTGVTVTALCPGATASGFQRTAGVESMRIMRRRQMSAERVAREGYEALMRGTSVHVPGMRYRLMVWVSKYAPRGLVLRSLGWLQTTIR